MAATLAGDPQETPGPSFLERTITRVVVEFWGSLRGFAALGLPMKGWGQVGRTWPETPFSERGCGRAALCAA
jgi:hypothetical protein